MKRLLNIYKFTVLFAIIFSINSYSQVTCVHYKSDILTGNICNTFEYLVKTPVNKVIFGDIIPHSDIIYFAGFGSPEGYWLNEYTNSPKVSWCELLKYSDYIIIDACYSGQVFLQCDTSNKTVITSTNGYSMSANVFNNGKWVSTMINTLNCLTTKACSDIIGCDTNNFDFSLCNWNIIIKNIMLNGYYYLDFLNAVLHPYLSIGTPLINDKPLH